MGKLKAADDAIAHLEAADPDEAAKHGLVFTDYIIEWHAALDDRVRPSHDGAKTGEALGNEDLVAQALEEEERQFAEVLRAMADDDKEDATPPYLKMARATLRDHRKGAIVLRRVAVSLGMAITQAVVTSLLEGGNSLSHVLFRTGDRDAPDQIKDCNGHVVLEYCRICGRAEVELTEPCAPVPSPEAADGGVSVDLIDRGALLKALSAERDEYSHEHCAVDPETGVHEGSARSSVVLSTMDDYIERIQAFPPATVKKKGA